MTLCDNTKKIGSPEAFTAKIIKILSKGKIIDSIKGIGGGFKIQKDKMKDIKSSQIVTSQNGDNVLPIVVLD
ncbi:hypothetical protein [Flavobacterium sp. 7A]|uniref:hypothetical protein n=1 Tax=Flavobacterium sp. 7A TaxID=2940571 RepID=UPI0022264EF7|nr:hypothetical protein [Flavobacterium sp. 7A]MCW2119516.1 DNA-binding IscR family transcriptional regulator [Flavobacterium sp. 7A]